MTARAIGGERHHCDNAECDRAVTQPVRGRSRKYCSSRCRTAAHRQIGQPREAEAGAQREKSPVRPPEIIEEKGGRSVTKRRTALRGHQDGKPVRAGLLTAPATFVTESPKARIGRPSRHPKAIPDPVHVGMYRVQWPDGRISDMANISRVNDAIAEYREKGSPR